MEKSTIIQDLCSDILCCSWINEEMSESLLIAAGLVEDHVTGQGCDVLGKTASELAGYINNHISVCSRRILDDVYFLLFELPGSTVH